MAAALLLIALLTPVSAISSGQYPPWRGNEHKAVSMLPSSMLQTDIAAEAAADKELEQLDEMSKVSKENMEMQERLKSTLDANEKKAFLAKKENTDTDDVNPLVIAGSVGAVLVILIALIV